jgi:solute carrier family 25 phosphate transporter 3
MLNVRTRMQLDPQKYNKGMISAFRQVVSTEGAGALATGTPPPPSWRQSSNFAQK